jgi:hypothetical protein
MRFAGETAKHPDGLFRVLRFPEADSVERNKGICSKNRAAGKPGQSGIRFASGQESDGFGGWKKAGFVDIRGISFKRKSQTSEQFNPARGTGRENQSGQSKNLLPHNLNQFILS